jgi:molybdopterin-guanine dinucleotide biosynthesis protein A
MNPEGAADRGPTTIVAVLAGGRGSRLGGDKATVELAGRPLISYPLAAAREARLPALIVARRDSLLPSLAERILREPDGSRHPLRGVVAALRDGSSGAAAVLAVGCDMPFVTAELLSHLADVRGSVVVTRAAGGLQPLPARYLRRHAAALERAADAGRSMGETLALMRPAIVEGPELSAFGDPRRLLFSVNGPEDLEQARRWLR